MAEKLTLKLGPRAPSTQHSSGIEVEVIKKRRLPGDSASGEGEAATSAPQASATADKLKSILENAKKFERSRELEAKMSGAAESARRAMIESEREKEEAEKAKVSQTPGADKKSKKGKDSYDDEAPKKDRFAFDQEGRRKKFSSDYSSRKLSFSTAGISAADLDDEDSATGAPSESLASAMDFVGSHTHRRSHASIKRQREKNWRKWSEKQETKEAQKISREVVLPETISVKDLSARMAEKSSDAIKAMMKLGIMATINQIIDADTAELVVMELGHTARRVSEADVETSILRQNRDEEKLEARPPVVTVMGHVDH